MPWVVPQPLRRTAGVSLAGHVPWSLLKVRLTAACAAPKAPNTTQRRTPSTKDALFVTFHMNSRQQIIVTTNTNNLQGDQTLDINKDTLDMKESPCWMWLLGCVGATARPLSPGKAEASVRCLWNPHHKAGHLDPEHKLPVPPSAGQKVCHFRVTSSSCSWGVCLHTFPWALGLG